MFTGSKEPFSEYCCNKLFAAAEPTVKDKSNVNIIYSSYKFNSGFLLYRIDVYKKIKVPKVLSP